MNKTLSFFLIIFGVFFLKIQTVSAQVTIVPPNLFIPGNAHFASLQIKNAAPQSQEVTVKFRFAYPVTDSLGNMKMVYNNTKLASKYSIDPWIHAFPRSFTLAPNASQVVRILIHSPQDLKKGLYWTRVETSSMPQAPPVGANKNNNVSANITFRFNQITTAFLEVGDPTTRITIKSFRYNVAGSRLAAYIDSRRTGEAPFLGTISLDLYQNKKSKPVRSTHVLTSVYFEQTTKLTFNDIKALSPGNYLAKVTFKAERSDIVQKNLPNMNPVSKEFKVEIK